MPGTPTKDTPGIRTVSQRTGRYHCYNLSIVDPDEEGPELPSELGWTTVVQTPHQRSKPGAKDKSAEWLRIPVRR